MHQVHVITTSTPEVFDHVFYPEQNPSTLQYIQNQFQNISHSIMDSGKQFMEQSKQLFEQFYDSSVDRAARAAMRMINNVIAPNKIQRLDSLEDIQSASPMMQRYIMSEPYLREKYQQNLCTGYADTYLDPNPGFLRVDDYYWRRIWNGMVIEQPEESEYEWIATAYYEDIPEGDKGELTFDEQVDVIETQRLARIAAEAGFDPTDPFGSKIG